MQAIFGAIFAAPKFAMKISSVSNMFKTSCNLVAIWGKTEVNIANKQGPNRTGIATTLHLQQKLHLKVQQKSHQKSHV